MKRTYQPSNTKRRRKHGFLKRMESAGGCATIRRRRHKGRARLTIRVPKK